MKLSFLFVLFLLWPALTLGDTSEPGVVDVAVLSDIHFDPLADPRLTQQLVIAPASQWKSIFKNSENAGDIGKYGKDTDYGLFESTLSALKNLPRKPELLIIPGDFVAHELNLTLAKLAPGASYEAFIEKTIDFVAAMLEEALPDTQFVPVIGNNDSPYGDYQPRPSSPFLEYFAETWAHAVTKDHSKFVNEFKKGGYYSIAARFNSQLRLIVADGVFWSADFIGDKTPGDDEMNWLENQLQAAQSRHETVWLIDHIPPGVDAYESQISTKTVLMYEDSFNTRFLNLLNKDSAENPIQMAIFGHTHYSNFELFNSRTVLGLLAPAVSPVFGNNPAFEVITVSKNSARVLEQTTYFRPLKAGDNQESTTAPWQLEYRFTEASGCKDVSAASYGIVLEQLKKPGPARDVFFKTMLAQSPQFTHVAANPNSYLCAIDNHEKAVFQNCFGTSR